MVFNVHTCAITSGPHYILKKIFNNAAARLDQLEQANYYAYQHILKNCDFLKKQRHSRLDQLELDILHIITHIESESLWCSLLYIILPIIQKSAVPLSL